MPDQLPEILNRLVQVNEVISKLSPEIRAPAFAHLVPFIFGVSKPEEVKPDSGSKPPSSAAAAVQADTTSIEAFFAGFSHDKPADNVLAICAWLYSLNGVFSATTEEIEAIASRVGLTIPRRLDMTLNVAKRDGKALFSKVGGSYSPTVHGELFLKQTYGVKKGVAKT